MRGVRMSRCINCKALPVISEQRGHYPFRLDHGCTAEFGLESHQKTRELCVLDWNRRNVRPEAGKGAGGV